MDDFLGGEDDPGHFDTPEEALQYLRYLGTLDDAAIDLAMAAVALGLLFMPGLHVDRYRQHIRKLYTLAGDAAAAKTKSGAQDVLEMQVDVLREVLHVAQGYHGARSGSDDAQNANLIRVIERRTGLHVALGILYIAVARAQGWTAEGLSFPAHFLVRLEAGGGRVIIDPQNDGAVLDAAGLRRLLKEEVSRKAELSHTYYAPLDNRGILTRLQNTLKNIYTDNGDYTQALLAADAILAFAPDEYRVLFDKAVFYAKLGLPQQAVAALERYIALTPRRQERVAAEAFLHEITASMDPSS